MADGSDVAARAPHACAFFNAVQETLRDRRGIQPVAPLIPHLLQVSGYFTHIVPRRFHMPIGDWHTDPQMREMGREYREMVEMYARSMRAVLLEGVWAPQADTLIHNFIDEIRLVRGMVSTVFTVHARRG